MQLAPAGRGNVSDNVLQRILMVLVLRGFLLGIAAVELLLLALVVEVPFCNIFRDVLDVGSRGVPNVWCR